MPLTLQTPTDPGTATFSAAGTLDQITDPGDAGAISNTAGGSVPLVTAGAETRTLGLPTFAGQTLTLYMATFGGNCVVAITGTINQTGNNRITLTAANQSTTLIGAVSTAAGALLWRVAENDGPTLSTV